MEHPTNWNVIKANRAKAKALYRTSPVHRARQVLAGIKRRAKDKGLEYNLTTDWLASRYKHGYCEITGLPFRTPLIKPGHTGPNTLSPSVDRIDNSKGYTMDNCRVILNCINTFKQDLTDKQVLKIAERLVGGLMKHGSFNG